jgi:hypothetical protein
MDSETDLAHHPLDLLRHHAVGVDAALTAELVGLGLVVRDVELLLDLLGVLVAAHR